MKTKRIKNRSGITLVEMLLVITILVILFAVVLIVIDPPYRFAQTRNTERSMETREIIDGIFLYYVDHDALPVGIDSSMKMIGTSGTGCAAACDSYVMNEIGPESYLDRLARLSKNILGIPTVFAAPLVGEPPEIASASVSPISVRPGDTMTVRLEVTDDEGVVSVDADMGGIETIDLHLVNGDAQNGIWQAEWLVHSTGIQEYTTVITAWDANGLLSTAEVVWTDPPASGWVSPVSFNDPGSQWINETYAYDGNSTTYSSNTYGSAGYGQFIELSLAAPTLSDHLQIKADYTDAIITAVDVDVYSGGVWIDVFEGGNEAAWNGQFVEVSYTQMTIDQVRFRYNYAAGGYYYWLYELQVYQNAPVVVLPICGTQTATAIQSTSSVIHVDVDDDGGEAGSVTFQYGKTIAYGSTTSTETGVTSSDSVSRLITSLDSGTTYHYRAQITNGAGTTNCPDKTFVTAVNDVEWLIPTAHSDPTSSWQDEVNAYDDTLLTFASDYHAIGESVQGDYIVFNHDPLAVDAVRWYARGGEEVDSIEVDVYKNGAWTNVYNGSVSDQSLTEVNFDSGVVSSVRVRFTTPYTNRGFFWELFEIAIHKSAATSSDECLDLSTDLSPEYIAEMPVDPKDGTPEQTLYAIRQTFGGSIEVVACNAELGEIIVATR